MDMNVIGVLCLLLVLLKKLYSLNETFLWVVKFDITDKYHLQKHHKSTLTFCITMAHQYIPIPFIILIKIKIPFKYSTDFHCFEINTTIPRLKWSLSTSRRLERPQAELNVISCKIFLPNLRLKLISIWDCHFMLSGLKRWWMRKNLHTLQKIISEH